MDIDHSVEGAELAAEHGFGELLATSRRGRHRAAELSSKREFDAGQINLNAVHPHFARGRIEPDLTDDEELLAVCRASKFGAGWHGCGR